MSDPLWMREDWKADSLKWRGEVLKGEYAHWCNEWDGLPVDETCSEFMACLCFVTGPEFTAAQERCRIADEARRAAVQP